MPDFLKEKLKRDYYIVIKCKALFKCFVANKRHILVLICAEECSVHITDTFCEI